MAVLPGQAQYGLRPVLDTLGPLPRQRSSGIGVVEGEERWGWLHNLARVSTKRLYPLSQEKCNERIVLVFKRLQMSRFLLSATHRLFNLFQVFWPQYNSGTNPTSQPEAHWAAYEAPRNGTVFDS